MMDPRRESAAKVAVTFTEPLISKRDRAAIEVDLEAHILTDPVWTGAWLSGLLHSTMQSIPARDPWRQLAASYRGLPFGTLAASPSESPAEAEGPERVWNRRGRFGSLADHTDLATSDWPGHDRLADLEFAAAHTQLPLGAATLLAAAGRSWQQTLLAWWVLYRESTAHLHTAHLTTPRPDGSATSAPANVMEASMAALTSVLFRRRRYVGDAPDIEFVAHAHSGFLHCDSVAADIHPVALDQSVELGRLSPIIASHLAFGSWTWPDVTTFPDTLYDDFRVD